MRLLAAVLCLVAMPLGAQSPRPLDSDARLETIEWRDGFEIPLRTTQGGALTIIFAPGEVVQTVVVGDSQAVQIAVAPQADSLLLRALRKPLNNVLEVRTQLRSYRFRVVMGPANDVAYAVRFSIASPDAAGRSGQTASGPPAVPAEALHGYSLKGVASLRPVRVSDDGLRTFIEWAPDQTLPAVFALNVLGEEETVDSYMRDGVMVIDRVYSRLVFRVGKHKAQAERQVASKRRRP